MSPPARGLLSLLSVLIGVIESIAGSMISLVIYMHYDLEGWYAQRRARHGEKLENKKRSIL
jgi:hypothetical protein